MLTFFTTAKPFVGHIGVIQRNAIRSWQRLHPDIEIILMGDDAGAAEACAELGVRHIAEVRRNKYRTKYLADIYERARAAARHEILCHINCDIILKVDFLRAVERVAAREKRFLMAGRRWDVDVTTAIDFGAADWEARVERLAVETNRQRLPQWIDYRLCVFARAVCGRGAGVCDWAAGMGQLAAVVSAVDRRAGGGCVGSGAGGASES